MTLTTVKGFLLTVAAAGLAACATIEEQPATAELPPVGQPNWEPGYSLVQTNVLNGTEGGWTVLAVETDRVMGRNVDGCRFVQSTDWFAPTLQWENCDGFTGSREITNTEGTLWPLQVGNTARYEFTNNDGRRGNRRCEVEAAVNIAVAEELVDAYKVVCRQDQRTRTWYWSPERREVKFINRHNQRGVTDHWDQIRSEIVDPDKLPQG